MQTYEMSCVEFVNPKGENVEGLDLQKPFPDSRLPHKILVHPDAIHGGCPEVRAIFKHPETEVVQDSGVAKRFLVLHYGPPPSREVQQKRVAERREAELEARKVQEAAKE